MAMVIRHSAKPCKGLLATVRKGRRWLDLCIRILIHALLPGLPLGVSATMASPALEHGDPAGRVLWLGYPVPPQAATGAPWRIEGPLPPRHDITFRSRDATGAWVRQWAGARSWKPMSPWPLPDAAVPGDASHYLQEKNP